MFFSVITKNLNWEILTKNFVIFKRMDGVKDQKIWYYGGSLKNLSFRGGRVPEKPIYRVEFSEKEGLRQFADLRGAWWKRGGGILRGVWYPIAHCYQS